MQCSVGARPRRILVARRVSEGDKPLPYLSVVPVAAGYGPRVFRNSTTLLTVTARRLILLALLAGLLMGLPGSQGWAGAASRGDMLSSQHRYLSALRAYAEAAQFPGGSHVAALRTGRAHLAREEWQQAAEAFRPLAERPNPPREALLALADASSHLDDTAGAEKYLRRELEVRPGGGEAWCRLVESAARRGLDQEEIRALLGDLAPPLGDARWGQRAAYLLGAAVLDPASVQGRAALAKASSGSDRQLAELAGELAQALDGSSSGRGQATDLPSALIGQGLVGPALGLLEMGGAGAGTAPAEALRGYALLKLGRVDEARRQVETALSAGEEDPLVRFTEAMLLKTEGRKEEAARALHSASRLDPANPAIWAELANLLFDLGDYGTGEQALRLAVAAAPESADLRLAAAEFYADRQFRLEEALSESQEAVRLSGRSPESLSALGWVLHLSGRTEEALKPLEEAVALAPGAASLRYRLGSVYDALGRKAEARDQYTMVAELDGSGEHWKRAMAALSGG